MKLNTNNLSKRKQLIKTYTHTPTQYGTPLKNKSAKFHKLK